MNRIPARKAKHTKLTREEILESMGWEPLDFPPGVPADVVEAENRRMQDEIVGWVQGLAAHIDKYDRAQKAARRPMRYPAASVQVEIDPASEVGAMMAELRRRIDRADLAGKGIEPQPDITVRSGIVGSDLDGLRSLNPFEITFGRVSFFPASVNSDNAAVLKVDVISPLLEEINLAMEQHANCRPSDSDYQPHAIVAYVKPKAVKKYVGNKLLAGRRMEVSALSIRPKGGEPEFVQLIDAPAPWKQDDYNWPGDEVKPPQRKRAKSSPSRTGAKKTAAWRASFQPATWTQTHPKLLA
jgi:2'-5' RNA ligase